ncbi:MAG TPA: hypothetical protein PK821_01810 [Victivallales bacterium]|nr:hypothetical protein [Victivallales bacterium]
MDLLFHSISGCVLSRILGEERTGQICLAGVVAVNPDIVAFAGRCFGHANLSYAFSHSLVLQVPIFIGLLFFNWRVSFCGFLHILADIFTHRSSTRYILYPFVRTSLPIGLDWWRAEGLIRWLAIWSSTLFLIYVCYRKGLLKKIKTGGEVSGSFSDASE